MGVEWYERSGALELAKKSNVSFEEYVQRAFDGKQLNPEDERQINLDIPRSIVSLYKYVLKHEEVDEDSDLPVEPVSKHMDSLTRILKAYCVKNPRIGYVQSHNDVVSFLLGQLKEDEAKVFWVYCVVLDRLYPSDFFSRVPKLQGLHVDMEVLASLLLKYNKAIKENVSEDDVASISSLLAFKWFIPVWVGEVPPTGLIAVWNRMLTDDLGSILHFRLALAIMESVENQIVQSVLDEDSDASFAYKLVLKAASQLTDVDGLLSTTHTHETLTEEEVEWYREQVRSKPKFVQEEISALDGITRFDRKQLEQLEFEFRILKEASHRKGQKPARGIDQRILGQILGRCIPEWPPTIHKRLFRILEPDGRGNIDFQKLMVILSILVKGSVEEKIKLCFDLYDTNKTGILGVEEMIKMAGTLCQIYEVQRKASDCSSPSKEGLVRSSSLSGTDGSQRQHALSSDQFSSNASNDGENIFVDKCGRVLPTTFIEKMLQMDVNGDRKITCEQWRKGALTEPYITRCFAYNTVTVEPNSVRNAKMKSIRRSLSTDFMGSLSEKRRSIHDSAGINVEINSDSIQPQQQEWMDNRTLASSVDSALPPRRISLLSPKSSRILHESNVEQTRMANLDTEAVSVTRDNHQSPAELESIHERSLCHSSCTHCQIS